MTKNPDDLSDEERAALYKRNRPTFLEAHRRAMVANLRSLLDLSVKESDDSMVGFTAVAITESGELSHFLGGACEPVWLRYIGQSIIKLADKLEKQRKTDAQFMRGDQVRVADDDSTVIVGERPADDKSENAYRMAQTLIDLMTGFYGDSMDAKTITLLEALGTQVLRKLWTLDRSTPSPDVKAN